MKKNGNVQRLEFTIRPSVLLRLLIMVPAVLVGIVSSISRSWIVFFVGATLLAIVGVWCIKFAYIRLLFDNNQLEIFAPLYHRRIEISEIAEANVRDDDGLSYGFINWPVTGSRRSASGVRINMGGKAALWVKTKNLETYQIVFADKHAALACLSLIRHIQNTQEYI